MEMKGIIEHSILEDDAEICSRAARYRKRENMGDISTCARWRRVKLSAWCTGSNRTEAGGRSSAMEQREKRKKFKKRNALRL